MTIVFLILAMACAYLSQCQPRSRVDPILVAAAIGWFYLAVLT